tara:strand:- start:560 stop:958 length:399 start_codon:yes stop_codon:yes gene_type:complete
MTFNPQYSVLVTDDDETCRASLRDILEPGGYRTHLASSGIEAIEIIRQEYIHVAILDVHMPEMTGVETWERILEEGNRRFPCVFMTGDVSYADRLQADLEEPSCVVIKKPLTRQIVITTLEMVLVRFGELNN